MTDQAHQSRQRSSPQRDLWDRFWKDAHGEVVIYQRPNVLLIAWVVLTIVSLVLTGTVSNVLYWVAMAVLAVWALLEIFKGVNYLRRLLGVVVALLIIAAIFKVGY